MKKPLLIISLLLISAFSFSQYLAEPQEPLQKPSVLVLEDIINLPEEKPVQKPEQAPQTEPVKEEKKAEIPSKTQEADKIIKQTPKEETAEGKPAPAMAQKTAQTVKEFIPAGVESHADYDWKRFTLGSLYVLVIAAIVFLMSKYQ